MNHDINRAAQSYIGMIEDRPAAFCAVLHFPHPKVDNFKMVSRLVVLPDYQGIGLGLRMVNAVAEKYRGAGFRVFIVTSNPALRSLFEKNAGWILKRFGRVPLIGKGTHRVEIAFSKTSSTRRLTMSWEYIDKKKAPSVEGAGGEAC